MSNLKKSMTSFEASKDKLYGLQKTITFDGKGSTSKDPWLRSSSQYNKKKKNSLMNMSAGTSIRQSVKTSSSRVKKSSYLNRTEASKDWKPSITNSDSKFNVTQSKQWKEPLLNQPKHKKAKPSSDSLGSCFENTSKNSVKETDDRFDLSKYIENQQKRMMSDSQKHVQKITDQQTKRMKLFGQTQACSFRRKKAMGSALHSPKSQLVPKKETITQALNSNRHLTPKNPKGLQIIGGEYILDDLEHEVKEYIKEPEKQISNFEVPARGKAPLNSSPLRAKKGIIGHSSGPGKHQASMSTRFSPLGTSPIKKGDQSSIKKLSNTLESPRKPPPGSLRKDYQLNDMHKIINFLDKDKNLHKGKEELSSHLRKFRMELKKDEVQEEAEECISHLNIKEEAIGTGSYAVVKLAYDKNLKQEVAIKFYDKIKMVGVIKQANFEAEVANLRELDHPSIVKLLDVITTTKRILMVMEYIGSYSLYDLLCSSNKSAILERGRF